MSEGDRVFKREAIDLADDAGAAHRLGCRAWLLAALVFIFALCCYLPMLGDAPISGTEGHRAITAHQMVQSGEWLVPRMFGKIYLAKPPLHYWILGTLEKLTGSATPIVWRLPAAIEGALLAAILCLFGYRWFGDIGGAVSGFAYVGLITMWGENRGAELDAPNTLTATIAALCLIELLFGSPKRRAPWILAAGLMAGASFMVKGPASLTTLLGVLLTAAIDARRCKRMIDICRPAMWLPMVIGAVICALYALAVFLFLRKHHLPIDYTGVQEGLADSHPLTLGRFLSGLLMPATLFAYALPVSLALPLNFLPSLRQPETAARRISSALAFSVLLGWGVCVAVAMHNPRYGFITLPLLCPLTGAIAARVPGFQLKQQKVIRDFAIGSGIGYGLAALVLGHLFVESRDLLLTVSITAIVCLVVMIYLLWYRNNWRGAVLLPVLIALASLPFAMMKNAERAEHSCLLQGLWLRVTVGKGVPLATDMMVLDQPDLFYFSGLPTTAYTRMDKHGNDQLDWRQLSGREWVVLEKPELDAWSREIPERMIRVIAVNANTNKGWLVLYDPSASEPSTARGRGHHGN